MFAHAMSDNLSARQIAEVPRVVVRDVPCRVVDRRLDRVDIPLHGRQWRDHLRVDPECDEVGAEPFGPTQAVVEHGVGNRVSGQRRADLFERAVDEVQLRCQPSVLVGVEAARQQIVDEGGTLGLLVCDGGCLAQPLGDGRHDATSDTTTPR